jgi:hypothetical protein
MPACTRSANGCEAVTNLVGREARHLDLLQHAQRLDKESGSCVRQRDRPLGPVKQPHAQLIFELANLLADRRLRNVESLRGPAEAQLLCDRYEIPEVPKFHALPLLSVAERSLRSGRRNRIRVAPSRILRHSWGALGAARARSGVQRRDRFAGES